MKGKKNNFKKQLSSYKNIPSKDLNIMKELIYLSPSTVIKLYDVEAEARTRWVQRMGPRQFPFANTKTFFCWNGKEENPELNLVSLWTCKRNQLRLCKHLA